MKSRIYRYHMWRKRSSIYIRTHATAAMVRTLGWVWKSAGPCELTSWWACNLDIARVTQRAAATRSSNSVIFPHVGRGMGLPFINRSKHISVGFTMVLEILFKICACMDLWSGGSGVKYALVHAYVRMRFVMPWMRYFSLPICLRYVCGMINRKKTYGKRYIYSNVV